MKSTSKVVWGSLCFSAAIFVLLHRTFQFPTEVGTMKLTKDGNATSDDPYVIVSSELPNQAYSPTVANGYIGHAIYSDTIYMNGLYNGEKGDSHRARIPGTLPYVNMEKTTFVGDKNLQVEARYSPKYEMHMKNGTYTQIFNVSSRKSEELLCSVSQTFYAHRLLTRVLATQISVEFKVNGTLKLALSSSSGDPSTDIQFDHTTKYIFRSVGVRKSCGHTLIPEQPGMSVLQVCIYSSNFPCEMPLAGKSGEVLKLTYLTSISHSEQEAEKFFELACEMKQDGVLLAKHQEEWQKTWKNGSILVTTENLFYSSSFISAIYYLLSAFPPSSASLYPFHFFGASPGGLTNGGKDQSYLGHVFWDQDFWMLPALLPIFPNAVRQGLEYRIARLNEAKVKAERLGFKGAMYPWESAYTGMDVCPGESYIIYEQHVTGDLIHMLKKYIYVTNDWSFLLEKIRSFPPSQNHTFNTAWDMAYKTAKFWYSRATWNSDKTRYVINGVMGPDEYRAPVDNSAFTNAVACQNLEFTLEAADELNIPIPEKEHFQKVVEKLFLPYDKRLNYHPEFDGFNPVTDTVKQADAIMLGFPLLSAIPESSRQMDLEIYGNVTDPNGPAMTWSMFSIGWNELGHTKKADQYFLRQQDNIQAPFQIWSEEPNGGGAVNFLTGIGGYLQSVYYGYVNLRIHKTFFTLNPRLPPALNFKTVTKMLLSGLKFQGVILDVNITASGYSVILSGWTGKDSLSVLLHCQTSDVILSSIGDEATFPVKTVCQVSVHSLKWS